MRGRSVLSLSTTLNFEYYACTNNILISVAFVKKKIFYLNLLSKGFEQRFMKIDQIDNDNEKKTVIHKDIFFGILYKKKKTYLYLVCEIIKQE